MINIAQLISKRRKFEKKKVFDYSSIRKRKRQGRKTKSEKERKKRERKIHYCKR